MPPMTPEPSHIIHNWCWYTPRAEMSKPPHQHKAATTPALRGPARSSQPPNSAAEEPRNRKNRMYMIVSDEMRQSQVELNNSVIRLMSVQATGSLMPSARESGNQNTEKP